LSDPEQTYGGRYAVIERVGAGGMAEVYRARDELLGREVAVKVLSERFARDRSFVERFRREAQSAAALSHPNIVSLYDYGSDNATYFIVMEFIDGKPLSEIISEGPLLPERAAEIASDVAKALRRAHDAGLVHRDIKPSNIMITGSGQTKVTDFGIARALARDGEQTVTQTGMVMGTAAYLSPEQAQGNPVDQRSDIYSLGCVLHEMLTGDAPFTGDTPLAIAYKHVRENPVPPSALNADVPRDLDALVLKAMAKNPDNRYQSAAELAGDLDRFLAGQKVHATPLLADETAVAPAASDTRVLEGTEAYPAYEEKRRGAGWYVAIALLILALFGLIAWWVANNLLGETVTVPNVVGMEFDEAQRELEDRGLEWEIERGPSRRPVGIVFDQDPDAREEAREGDTVTLFVSEGRRQVEVPDLTGLTVDEAEDELKDSGLRLGDVNREPNDEFEEGQVFEQSPDPGAEVDARSEVDVTVSEGETVTVPDVIGEPQAEAIDEIEAAGLVADPTSEPNNEFDEGIVFAQDPGAGAEAERGDVVRITVSEGPEARDMPDVTGQDADEAEEFLENDYGLNVSQATEPCAGQPPGAVCRQEPEPGTPVEPGDEATLFVQPGEASLELALGFLLLFV
jgi:serine/threonine-protein kinase